MTMKKRVIERFGIHYLLGKDKDGVQYWLESPSWDCSWYWGMGYIHAYTNNKNPEKAKDIAFHSHFDVCFGKNTNFYDGFRSFMADTPITDEELWELCDLMKTAYTLRRAADTFYVGNSQYTNKGKINLKDEKTAYHINMVVLPKIFDRIKEILSPENDTDNAKTKEV